MTLDLYLLEYMSSEIQGHDVEVMVIDLCSQSMNYLVRFCKITVSTTLNNPLKYILF